MYNEYFGFKEAPFSIAPDPRYLYMTAQHRDALAHLVYGLNSEGGCILLTGEVGTGKTTICRCLLEQVPEQANIAMVLNPKVSEIELLETICDELNISYPDAENSVKTYTDRIYKYLIESNRKNKKIVLIIDEAQNLDSTVLEQLRLLTNLETNQRKLLQIIILGQPELLDILSRPEMRQLAQRITARFHLEPLSRFEVKAYVGHRLAVAGQNIQLFPDKSIKLLYHLSHGIPRLINIICDRALLGAYVENQYAAHPQIVKKAAKEVFGELKNVESHRYNKRRATPIAATLAIISVLLVIFAITFINTDETNSSVLVAEINTDTGNKNETLTTLAKNTINNNVDINNQPTPDKKTPTDITEQLSPTVNTALSDTFERSQEGETIEPGSEPKVNNITEIINSKKSNQATAYDELFNTWHQQYNKKTITTACKQADHFSLSCLHKKGNFNSLKAYNRPAVLTLFDNQGNPRHITITTIDDVTATILSNHIAYTIKLSDLDKHWYGQFILLWKKPAHYISAISPGDSGDIVNWLNKTLISIDNKNEVEAISYTYDDNMVNKVKAFQKKHGLTADGIVGPVTIIHLNTQSGMQVPSLTVVSTQEQES